MTRLDDIRARVEAVHRMAPRTDGEYLCPNCQTPWKCTGPHIPDPGYDPALDVLESHARQDIPALLAVAEAAKALLSAETEREPGEWLVATKRGLRLRLRDALAALEATE